MKNEKKTIDAIQAINANIVKPFAIKEMISKKTRNEKKIKLPNVLFILLSLELVLDLLQQFNSIVYII